jgi:LytS/YehU family sensor histidine kinase
VRRKGQRLQYTVSDDGAGLPDTPVAPGTGLSNISRRLELLFPGAYTFNLAARVPRGAVVTIDFPIEKQEVSSYQRVAQQGGARVRV